ncbi:MAG: MFS transporter [Candidatus Hydrogenedentes bacterium]|nr:MFS transporter [Candidatus Hydrogenedentota bacterium]
MSSLSSTINKENCRETKNNHDNLINKNKTLFILDAGLAQTMTSLCTGAFLTAYALYLGGGYIAIGVLNAVLCFGVIIQIPSTIFVENYPENRKHIAVIMLTISRILLILAGFLPLILQKNYRFESFFILYLGFVLIGNIGGCAFGAWFRDAFSPMLLYNVITSRFTISTLMSAVVSLFAGFALEGIKIKYPNIIGHAYSYTFVIAGTFGIGSSIALNLINTYNSFQKTLLITKRNFKLFSEPIKDTIFIKVLLFIALWNFIFNLINPFLPVFFLKRTNFSLLFVICLTVINQLATVLSFPVWQKYSLSFGAKSLLSLCTPLFFLSVLSLIPLPSINSESLITALSIISNVLYGFFVGGIVLCITNLVFQKSPEGKSTAYLSLNNAFSGLVAGISSISAGYFANVLNHSPYTVQIDSFKIMMSGLEILFFIGGIVGIFSVICIPLLIPSNVLKDS